MIDRIPLASFLLSCVGWVKEEEEGLRVLLVYRHLQRKMRRHRRWETLSDPPLSFSVLVLVFLPPIDCVEITAATRLTKWVTTREITSPLEKTKITKLQIEEDEGLNSIAADRRRRRLRGSRLEKKKIGPVDPAWIGPFQTDRVRFGSKIWNSITRPDPARCIFMRVRSGPAKFEPGPARAHP